MKGITQRQNLCRFVKMFLVANAVAGLSACVEEMATPSPQSAPDVLIVEPELSDMSNSCSDGVDNDLDGWLDGADPDCADPDTSEEIGFGDTACNNGLDDDGDAAVDSADTECQGALDNNEFTAEADVVISEFMANPSAVSDSYGEWFELYNTTDADIDLFGWTIADAAGSHLIADSLVVPALGYVVLTRATDDVNGLSPLDGTDYVYGTSLYFSNSGEEIHLLDPYGNTIDSVIYTAEQVAAGASTIIDGTSWCVSTQLISGGAGDYGSPGAENEVCP